MGKKRIVRDIQNRIFFPISLEDGGSVKKKKSAESAGLNLNKKNSGSGKKEIDTIKSKKGEKKYLYLCRSEENKKNPWMEVSKFAVPGIIILLVINLVNVYYRGVTIKDTVVSAAYSGYEDLLTGGELAAGTNFLDAEKTFTEANKNFDYAIRTLSFLQGNEEAFYGTADTIQTAKNLLEAARSISKAGKDFSRGIENMRHLPELFVEENQTPNADTQKQSLTDKLKEDLVFIENAAAALSDAKNYLNKVRINVLPEDLKEKFNTVKEALDAVIQLTDKARKQMPALLTMLGDRYPHRYLILLQNDSEVRPTGGFIGSYIIADLNDGYLTKLDFHDVYESDGQLQEYIEPPEDIARVSDTWRMRDSNYSPDFSISGEKAAWFLQKEKGPSVDSVIAINQSFVKDLLQITGPIQVEGLSKSIDEENFQYILSYIIESKVSASSPKNILGRFVESFQNRFAQIEDYERIFRAIIDGFSSKKILVYSRYENVEALLDEFGITGKITKTAESDDYLNVIVVSIGGNKSDYFIRQTIGHYSQIQTDGTVINEIVLTRQHTWAEKDEAAVRRMINSFGYYDISPVIMDILGKGINKSFIKVYVPAGSELLESSNVKMEDITVKYDEETEKTYFLFELEVLPFDKEVVTLKYRLPKKLRLSPVDTYKLFIQRQAGGLPSLFEKKITLQGGLEIPVQHPSTFIKDEFGDPVYANKLDKDLFLSALVVK
jgi:hypothetical protein